MAPSEEFNDMRTDFRPRIHPLPWPELEECRFWLLRDDEFGFAASGGKLRKYASLLPFLLSEKIQTAYLIGGRNSNNLVGLSQALLENGITPVPVLPEGHSGSEKGFNSLLLGMLVDPATWKEIPRGNWHNVEHQVEEWVSDDRKKGNNSVCIPEGAYHPAAISGCMALADVIVRWQIESGVALSHLVKEAGTGTSAIGLLLGSISKRIPKTEILLLADSKSRFRERLQEAKEWMGMEQLSAPAEGQAFDLHLPSDGIGFGKLKEKGIQTILAWARRGILLDPVYSVRLMEEVPKMAAEGKIKGNILLVHSGGAHSLAGYSEKLNLAVKSRIKAD